MNTETILNNHNQSIGTKVLDRIALKQEEQKTKTELEQLLHEKLLRSCRLDPSTFIDYAGSYNERHWLGLSSLHIKWHKALNEHNYVLLICPREHGKTTQIIYRIVWELGKNPNIRIKLICQGDDTAVKRLVAIIDLIENNPRVKEVFPHLCAAEKGIWTKSKIYVKRSIVGLTDPSLEASGVLSTGVGGRADLLVFDDPVDFRNAIQQPALRETVKEAYKNVWMNVLEETGRIWYIATLWHKDDLSHGLLKSNSYFSITDNIDENFNPIWVEKWNEKALRKKLENIGRRAFDRAFRNKALSDEDALFPIELLRRSFNSTFKFGQLPPSFDPKATRYFCGVDIGAGKSLLRGAYSVLFTIAYYNGLKVPVNILRGRFTSPQLARIVLDENELRKPELIYVENNAQQEALIQWVQEIAGIDGTIIPVRGFFTGIQKQNEEVGLPGLSVEFEQGSWIIPDPKDHEQPCKCGLCIWLDEMSDYPIGKYKDTVMTCWFAREAVRSLTLKVPKISSIMGSNKPRTFIQTLEDDDDSDI